MGVTVKLIIELPTDKYLAVKTNMIADFIYDAVKHGIPLPKGHGRLIDERQITKFQKTGLIMTDHNVRSCFVTDAPTIIEADKVRTLRNKE